MSGGAPLLAEIGDGIGRLTLNRPASGNSIDLELARALLRAAIGFDQDSSVRCVVVSAAGRMFCTGGDIGEFASKGEGSGAYVSELAGTMNLALSRLARMSKPLLVLVNGPAAGAGLSLALTGDIVLASRSADFTCAYTAIGLVPDCGLTWLLPRLVGLRKAQELIITNRRVPAEEAQDLGLVTRIVDDLEEEGRETARVLCAGAVAAIGETRALLLGSWSSGYEVQLEKEARAIARAAVAPEGRKGIAAFRAKTSPRFRSD